MHKRQFYSVQVIGLNLQTRWLYCCEYPLVHIFRFETIPEPFHTENEWVGYNGRALSIDLPLFMAFNYPPKYTKWFSYWTVLTLTCATACRITFKQLASIHCGYFTVAWIYSWGFHANWTMVCTLNGNLERGGRKEAAVPIPFSID